MFFCCFLYCFLYFCFIIFIVFIYYKLIFIIVIYFIFSFVNSLQKINNESLLQLWPQIKDENFKRIHIPKNNNDKDLLGGKFELGKRDLDVSQSRSRQARSGQQHVASSTIFRQPAPLFPPPPPPPTQRGPVLSTVDKP